MYHHDESGRIISHMFERLRDIDLIVVSEFCTESPFLLGLLRDERSNLIRNELATFTHKFFVW
jgi:hypothetical protein